MGMGSALRRCGSGSGFGGRKADADLRIPKLLHLGPLQFLSRNAVMVRPAPDRPVGGLNKGCEGGEAEQRGFHAGLNQFL